MITEVNIFSNPRQEDGGFGEFHCDMCGISSGAFIELVVTAPRAVTEAYVTVCKGCLLGWVDKIDSNLLEQCKR